MRLRQRTGGAGGGDNQGAAEAGGQGAPARMGMHCAGEGPAPPGAPGPGLPAVLELSRDFR